MQLLRTAKSPGEVIALLCVGVIAFFALIVVNKIARAWGQGSGMEDDEFVELDHATSGLKKGILVLIVFGILFVIVVAVIKSTLGAR